MVSSVLPCVRHFSTAFGSLVLNKLVLVSLNLR